MTSADLPVNKSLREINGDTWILGGKIIISRHSYLTPATKWDDAHGLFYSISDACEPSPLGQPLSSPNLPRLIYDAGDVSAVWDFGNAIVKFKKLESPHQTREHVTLAALHSKSLSFTIPNVLYHIEISDRYCIIQNKLQGRTLAKSWPSMDEEVKQYYVNRIVDVCKELSAIEAEYIGGIDGNQIPDRYLAELGPLRDFSQEKLLQNCKALGMDCFTFVFFHSDMGPGNLIVNPDEKSLAIIDWEIVGFVPREWVRTKFRVGAGFDFDGDDFESRVDWRRRVQVRLGEAGFSDVVGEWNPWRMKKL